MRKLLCAGAAALLLAACGQQQPGDVVEPGSEVTDTGEVGAEGAATIDLPPVDPALVAAPSTDFTAVEPTELGVTAAPTIEEALAALIATGAHGPETEETGQSAEGAAAGQMQLSVRTEGEHATADIVRAMPGDDSLSAAHLRIEFQSTAEGWFPINAYRRQQCSRGPAAGGWSATPCP